MATPPSDDDDDWSVPKLLRHALTDLPAFGVGIVVGGGLGFLVFLLWKAGICRICRRRRRPANVPRSPASRLRTFSVDCSPEEGEFFTPDGDDMFGAIGDAMNVQSYVAFGGEDTIPANTDTAPLKKPSTIIRRLLGQSCPRQDCEPTYRPPPGSRPPGCTWSIADTSRQQLRVGPDYPRNGYKEPSLPALFAVRGIDIVHGSGPIGEVVPDRCPLPEELPGWSRDLRIPRFFVINGMMTHKPGPRMFGEHPKDDHGVSVVVTCVPTAETLRVARIAADGAMAGAEEQTLPAVRLLQTFFERATTTGVGKGARASGVMKVTGSIESIEKVSMPALIRPTIMKFNGKPILLIDQAVTFKDHANGEWMEFGFDMRKFGYPARSTLVNLGHRLKEQIIHMAFALQGDKDDELPEVALVDFRLHNFDVMGGVWLDDARGSLGAVEQPTITNR